MNWRIVALTIGLTIAMGCRHTAAPVDHVPLIATEDDFQRLSGEWSGTYESRELGRSGNILFRLSSNAEGAQGEVVMQNPPAPAASLRIEFVRVTHDQISGVIERYPDPEGSGTLETHFVGKWSGDVIEGGFVTYASGGGPPRSGIWRVVRK